MKTNKGKKWKPRVGETWWFVVFDEGCFTFEPCSEIQEADDSHIYEMPIFKTQEQCKAFCYKLNEAIRKVEP